MFSSMPKNERSYLNISDVNMEFILSDIGGIVFENVGSMKDYIEEDTGRHLRCCKFGNLGLREVLYDMGNKCLFLSIVVDGVVRKDIEYLWKKRSWWFSMFRDLSVADKLVEKADYKSWNLYVDNFKISGLI